MATIIALFGGLGGWAAFTSISGAVIASGVVTVETKVETVQPTDIDQIRIDQKAIVRFSAFSARSTQEMNGKVIQVSADSIVDKVSGMSSFLAILEVPDSETVKLGKNKLLPGMSAEAFIRTQDRTAISYLLKPLTDNLNRTFREE